MREAATLRRLVAVAAIAAFLGACSTGPDPQAERDLRQRVAAVRTAAESGDRDAAEQRLQELVDAVNSWQAQGAIDNGFAASILTAAAGVRDQLGLLSSPSPATVYPTEEPAPHTPPGHEEGHGAGNDEPGHGNGKGNGNGQD